MQFVACFQVLRQVAIGQQKLLLLFVLEYKIFNLLHFKMILSD